MFRVEGADSANAVERHVVNPALLDVLAEENPVKPIEENACRRR
jgi:hypothetical protein